MVAAPGAESERVIVAAIEKHARGDVAALARGIIEELRAAGLEIRRTDEIPIRNPRRSAVPGFVPFWNRSILPHVPELPRLKAADFLGFLPIPLRTPAVC